MSAAESVPLLRDPLQRTAEERCPSLTGFGDSPAQSGYGTGSEPSKEPRSWSYAWWILGTLLVLVALLLWAFHRGHDSMKVKEVGLLHLPLLRRAFLQAS